MIIFIDDEYHLNFSFLEEPINFNTNFHLHVISQMAGGSAAQSASLQILDALLCVEHTAG